MAAKKFIISALVLTSLIFVGCDKVPMNGDLDGMWQLMEIRTDKDTTDMKTSRLYCSFQLHLFMLSDPSHPQHYYGYFEHKDKTIRFYTFTYRSKYVEGNNYDQPMNDKDDLSVIAPWGFYSTDCTFDVVTLNNSEFVIKHDKTTIVYRKF